jgi:hypothetical protein
MYDTYHHYIYLWYPLVLCPVDFSERASAECAWGSSTTASFPEKNAANPNPMHRFTQIYLYIYIQLYMYTHTYNAYKYNMSYWSIRPQEAALSSTASKLFELTAVQDGPCHHAWESDSWIAHQLWQATIYWHGFPNLYDFMVFSNVFFGRLWLSSCKSQCRIPGFVFYSFPVVQMFVVYTY